MLAVRHTSEHADPAHAHNVVNESAPYHHRPSDPNASSYVTKNNDRFREVTLDYEQVMKLFQDQPNKWIAWLVVELASCGSAPGKATTAVTRFSAVAASAKQKSSVIVSDSTSVPRNHLASPPSWLFVTTLIIGTQS